ncbi:MAG: hypothetical protein V3U43_07155, partial [Pseudomonadales bacterium]
MFGAGESQVFEEAPRASLYRVPALAWNKPASLFYDPLQHRASENQDQYRLAGIVTSPIALFKSRRRVKMPQTRTETVVPVNSAIERPLPPAPDHLAP